jgi:P27 family predicted phage terminase small subunit
MPARKLSPDQRSPTSRGHGLGAIDGGRGLNVVPPEPDSGWSAETVGLWEGYWSDAVAGIVHAADMGTVLSYFRAYNAKRGLELQIEASPTVTNGKGDEIPNPAVVLVKHYAAEVKFYGDALGMSPKARLKLGVTFSQAAQEADKVVRSWTAADADDVPDPRMRAVVDVDEVS